MPRNWNPFLQAGPLLALACFAMYLRYVAVHILASAASFLAGRHPVAEHVVELLHVVLPLAAFRIAVALAPVHVVSLDAVTTIYKKLHRIDLVLVTILILAAGPASCTESITGFLRATGNPDPGVFDIIWFFYTHITESPCDGGLAVIVFLALCEAFALGMMPPPPPPPPAMGPAAVAAP